MATQSGRCSRQQRAEAGVNDVQPFGKRRAGGGRERAADDEAVAAAVDSMQP